MRRPTEARPLLVHSPRAAERFAQLAQEDGLDRSSVIIAAISNAAAEAVGSGWKTIQTADEPSDELLLSLAERLCDNPRQG